MKKIIVLIIVVSIASTMVFLMTGCTPKSVIDSKNLIDEYYTNLENDNFNNNFELMDEELLESLGGKERLIELIQTRTGFLGKNIGYEIVETTIDDSGEMAIFIEAKTQYDDYANSLQEVFELRYKNNEMRITNFYLERQMVASNIMDALFYAYDDNDIEKMISLFSIDIKKNDIAKLTYDMKKVLGKYKAYNIIEEKFYYEKKDNYLSLYKGSLNIVFEKGNAKVYIELGRDKAGVKILDIRVIPDIIQSAVNNYFELMKQLNYDNILDMYLDVFYQNTDGGRDGWLERLRFVNEFGEYKSHQIVDWEYNETKIDNKSSIDTFAVGVNARFGDTKQYNVFKMLINHEDNNIIYHTIEIEEK